MIDRIEWGRTSEGTAVGLWTLRNGDLEARFSELGARWVSWRRAGGDLLLGPSSVAEVEADTSCFVGAVVGRYAGRITRGRFTIAGRTYQVPPNEGRNALHGGAEGMWRQQWRSSGGVVGGRPTVRFSLVSPDGAMGFPGVLKVEASYTLASDGVRINYRAVSDAETVVNLTSHAYFNLAGSGDVRGHRLQVAADNVLGVDDEQLPTGQFWRVANTDLDLRTPRLVGEVCDSSDVRIRDLHGLDHSYALNGHPVAARLSAGGITVEVVTDQPGLQVYSGQSLTGQWQPYAGLCLETQHFPDAPNRPEFGTTVLEPGVELHSATTYRLVQDR